MTKLVSKKRHAVIRVCKLILNIVDDVNEDHLVQLTQTIQRHLDSGLSPNDIKNLYQVEYTDFGMFIKKCLKLSLLSSRDAVNNFYKKTGRSVTDEKKIYQHLCSFRFDPYSIPDIPGYSKLLTLGLYNPVLNPNGVCRDHMVSVEFGWRNKISPDIISHPSNCQFLTNKENIAKNDKSCLTIDDLLIRISINDLRPVVNTSRVLPRTTIHKQRISETNSKYMTITNGVKNLRILKTLAIPNGFRRGMTRKCKLVGAEGLEPPIR